MGKIEAKVLLAHLDVENLLFLEYWQVWKNQMMEKYYSMEKS